MQKTYFTWNIRALKMNLLANVISRSTDGTIMNPASVSNQRDSPWKTPQSKTYLVIATHRTFLLLQFLNIRWCPSLFINSFSFPFLVRACSCLRISLRGPMLNIAATHLPSHPRWQSSYASWWLWSWCLHLYFMARGFWGNASLHAWATHLARGLYVSRRRGSSWCPSPNIGRRVRANTTKFGRKARISPLRHSKDLGNALFARRSSWKMFVCVHCPAATDFILTVSIRGS